MNKKDGVGEICDAEVQTRKDIALKGVLFFPFFFSSVGKRTLGETFFGEEKRGLVRDGMVW